ncbi:DUF4435 domain-containing protein [Shewanella baltica]|uniref:DUF4435 domain-containing protein n=1 Tax=Shewanella baltica TaxID=62322 RepID=UPI003D7C01D5
MSAFPVYTPDENVLRIRMESEIKFVVVEGVDDVPIYESVILSILPGEGLDNWDVIHVGGKSNIKELIVECNSNNFICIADKDFDGKLSSEKVVSLNRYSIENYLICEEALSAALSIALRLKYQDVRDNFDLSIFYAEVEISAKKLLIALFYYQRVISPTLNGERHSWSDAIIHMHPPAWGLCCASIDSLISRLIPEDVTEIEMENYFSENFESSGVVAYDLPGKMLKVLLQKFVLNYYKGIKSGGSQFNSADSFVATIASSLNRSSSFVNVINPVLSFLYPRSNN